MNGLINKAWFSFFLIAIVLCLPTQMHAQATSPTVTFVDPQTSQQTPSVTLVTGSSKTIQLRLNPNGKQLSGVDVVLQYSPEDIQVSLPAFPSPAMFARNFAQFSTPGEMKIQSTNTDVGSWVETVVPNYYSFTVLSKKVGQSQIRFRCTDNETNDTNFVERLTGRDLTSCQSLLPIFINSIPASSEPTPTSPPTSQPTSTPIVSSTPNEIPLCLTISRDVQTPILGQQVRFTCGTVAGATSYEFRYRILESNEMGSLSPISQNSNISEPLTILKSGTYDVECKVCVKERCSPYSAW